VSGGWVVRTEDSGAVTMEFYPPEPPPEGFCRVYWGSHGCHEPRGHPADVPHACDCCECPPGECKPSCVARPPYYGPDTRFYGEEAEALGLPLVSELG
jgi:hypothetical protein